MTQLTQRLRLNLPNPLTGHVKLLADLLERAGLTTVEAEAQAQMRWDRTADVVVVGLSSAALLGLHRLF